MGVSIQNQVLPTTDCRLLLLSYLLEMTLETGSPVSVTGAQRRVGLGPDVADRTVFPVLDVMGNHQRFNSRPGYIPDLPSQRLKSALYKLSGAIPLNMTLPALFPSGMRMRQGDTSIVVQPARSVAVQAVFPAQRFHRMRDHQRRAFVEAEIRPVGSQRLQRLPAIRPSGRPRMAAGQACCNDDDGEYG